MAETFRTCCVCRKRGLKKLLLRIVVNEAGELLIDLDQCEASRGTYVHLESQCFSQKNMLYFAYASIKRIKSKNQFKQLLDKKNLSLNKMIDSIKQSNKKQATEQWQKILSLRTQLESSKDKLIKRVRL